MLTTAQRTATEGSTASALETRNTKDASNPTETLVSRSSDSRSRSQLCSYSRDPNSSKDVTIVKADAMNNMNSVKSRDPCLTQKELLK